MPETPESGERKHPPRAHLIYGLHKRAGSARTLCLAEQALEDEEVGFIDRYRPAGVFELACLNGGRAHFFLIFQQIFISSRHARRLLLCPPAHHGFELFPECTRIQNQFLVVAVANFSRLFRLDVCREQVAVSCATILPLLVQSLIKMMSFNQHARTRLALMPVAGPGIPGGM